MKDQSISLSLVTPISQLQTQISLLRGATDHAIISCIKSDERIQYSYRLAISPIVGMFSRKIYCEHGSLKPNFSTSFIDLFEDFRTIK